MGRARNQSKLQQYFGESGRAKNRRDFHNFVLNKMQPPRSYQRAIREGFGDAMKKEEEALETMGVYIKVKPEDLPEGIKPIPSKYVYTDKVLNERGDIKKKARIVVRGDLQDDIHDAYSPTTDRSVMRLFLTLAVENNWSIAFADFSNAF